MKGWVLVYQAYFDGRTVNKKNGVGLSSIGYIIYSDTGEEIYSEGKVVGTMTSMEAEYTALLFLVKKVYELGIEHIAIFGDHQVIINQMTVYKPQQIRKPWLAYRKKVFSYLSKLTSWRIEWIRSKKNKVADNLAKEAMAHYVIPETDVKTPHISSKKQKRKEEQKRRRKESTHFMKYKKIDYQLSNRFRGKLEKVGKHHYLAYELDSSSNHHNIYAVDLKHMACTCLAFVNGEQRPCKHLEAIQCLITFQK